MFKDYKIWEFSFNLDYKQKTAQDRHILFIRTRWYQVRRLPEEDDLRLVFHTHIHTHSQWGSEADMSDRLSSQTLREREKYSRVRDWKWEEWSKRWLRTCAMWGECAIINFHIHPCQPALPIATYKHLTHKLSHMHLNTPRLDGCMPTKTPIYCHTHSQKQFQIKV